MNAVVVGWLSLLRALGSGDWVWNTQLPLMMLLSWAQEYAPEFAC